MYSYNVFAVLTAYDRRNTASSAFRLAHNSQWLCEAKDIVAGKPIIHCLEISSLANNNAQSKNSRAGAVDGLVVTFDGLTERLHNGIQLGTNPELCHILLGYQGTEGISARQCNVTVDKKLRIWLHDYHSNNGTAVGHNDQNEEEVRKGESWILSYEPGAEDQFASTTINAGNLWIKVDFPHHQASHPDYLKNLQAFAYRCEAAVFPESELLTLEGVVGLYVQRASDAPLIYYRGKMIGKGGFGEVHLTFRARNGLVVASKTFRDTPNLRKHDEGFQDWFKQVRKDCTLMMDKPHPNVVEVFELREMPDPTIIMAYYPQGNMVDARALSETQRVSGLGQVLEALSHLHENGLVHRDLKPQNFLIELCPYFKVVITDFGLANVVINNAWVGTFSGSLMYMAPEVFPGLGMGYGPLADIWSMGVIGMEWLYTFPEIPDIPMSEGEVREIVPTEWEKWIKNWAGDLVVYLSGQCEDADPLIGILFQILEFKVSRRWPANKCLMRGLETGVFKRREVDGLIVCTEYREELQARLKLPANQI